MVWWQKLAENFGLRNVNCSQGPGWDLPAARREPIEIKYREFFENQVRR